MDNGITPVMNVGSGYGDGFGFGGGGAWIFGLLVLLGHCGMRSSIWKKP